MISQIFKNKLIREFRFVVTSSRLRGAMKTVKRYKLSVIRKVSPRDVLYNTTKN